MIQLSGSRGCQDVQNRTGESRVPKSKTSEPVADDLMSIHPIKLHIFGKPDYTSFHISGHGSLLQET